MLIGSFDLSVALLSVAILVLGSSARGTPPAVGPSNDEARRLAQRSIREYEASDFAPALVNAQKAFELSGAPELLFDIAQCHRALEHWKQAEFTFRNYLRRKPGASNRRQVLQLIAEMQAKEAQGAASSAPAPPASVAVPEAPRLSAPGPATEVKAEWASPEVAASAAARPAEARSHALSWTLLGASAAAGGIAAYGAIRVGSYERLLGQLSAQGNYSAYERRWGEAQASQVNTANWQVAAIALGALAALGLTAGVLTW